MPGNKINCQLILLLSALLVLTSCSVKKQQPVSRVSYFRYGGYGDTLYATLDGQIFYLDSSLKTKDSLTELAGVKITILENNKTLFSDSNGGFVINLSKGIFSILFTMEGFEPLVIKNYVSNPDQHSGTRIYLEKGKEPQIFVIPKEGKE